MYAAFPVGPLTWVIEWHVTHVSPAPDFHVPIEGRVHDRTETGAIEVIVRLSEPPCIESYGVAYDDVSPTAASR